MATRARNADRRRGIQSLETGLRVLECLEHSRDPLTLTQIAKASGMRPSKAHIYLISLMRAGMVVQESFAGRYELGPAALRVGLSALAKLNVLEKGRAEMDALRERTGHTAYLSVWGDFGPTVISRLDGKKVATIEVRVGSVMPLLTSATGNVFFAYTPESLTAPFITKELALQALTPSGRPFDRARAAELAAQVRRRGFSSTHGGVIRGIVAASAPVLDYQGDIRAALTLMGREQVLDVEADSAALKALLAGALAASRAAGYTGTLQREDVRPAARRAVKSA